MKCYICSEEASAICAFCGVALCKEHIKVKRRSPARDATHEIGALPDKEGSPKGGRGGKCRELTE